MGSDCELSASTTVCEFCKIGRDNVSICSVLVLVGTIRSCVLLCDSAAVVSGSRDPRP